jgi:hypothetical protein
MILLFPSLDWIRIFPTGGKDRQIHAEGNKKYDAKIASQPA